MPSPPSIESYTKSIFLIDLISCYIRVQKRYNRIIRDIPCSLLLLTRLAEMVPIQKLPQRKKNARSNWCLSPLPWRLWKLPFLKNLIRRKPEPTSKALVLKSIFHEDLPGIRCQGYLRFWEACLSSNCSKQVYGSERCRVFGERLSCKFLATWVRNTSE